MDGDLVQTKEPPIYILGYYDKGEDVFYYLCKNSIHMHPVGVVTRVLVERFTKTQVKAKVEFFEHWGGSEVVLLKPILFPEFCRVIKSDKIITIDSIEEWCEFCEREHSGGYGVEIMRKIFSKR